MRNRENYINRYRGENNYALSEYKNVLKKNQRSMDESIFVAWVNHVQTALIFYSLAAAGRLGIFDKRGIARDRLVDFEQHHNISTDILLNARRKFWPQENV